MKKLLVTLLGLLLSTVVMAQNQDTPLTQAEAYMYGHVIGPVSVADIATDGQVITLKGVQYWPRLSASSDLPPKEDAAKKLLHQRLWSLHSDMLKNGKSVLQTRQAMAELMRQDPLVLAVREPSDPNDNTFEYLLKNDISKDWIVVEGIGLNEERPSYAEMLETELGILSYRIENGWTIVVSPEGGFFVPPNARDNQKVRIQEEIQAAINGQWSGNLLTNKEVELFHHPLDIAAATARFHQLHQQED